VKKAFAIQGAVTYLCASLKIRIAMPKMKTHSGAKKRFSLTGKKKVKRFHAFTSHMMRNKSKKAKMRLVKSDTIHPSDEKRVKRMLVCG
jgi:large subunit ribosomal protein L35